MEGTTYFKSTTEERHFLRLTGKCMCSMNLGDKVHWLSRDMVLSAGREKFIDCSIVPAGNISIACAMEMLFDLDIGSYIKDGEKIQN